MIAIASDEVPVSTKSLTMEPIIGENLKPCPDMPTAKIMRESALEGPTIGAPSTVNPSVHVDTR